MEYEILDALADLRYAETVDEKSLDALIQDTQKYSRLLAWICLELNACTKLNESVTVAESEEDVTTFYMELGSLLKELNCPWSQLMEGSSSERFERDYNRKLTLNFLLSELQAARISYASNDKQLKVEICESPTAKLLREMLQTLDIPKPPEGLTIQALMEKVNKALETIFQKMPPDLKGKPLFVGELSPMQWEELENLNKQFHAEYKLRRQMLLKRLDVTIQSFHWSDRLKSKSDQMSQAYREIRDDLSPEPNVRISHVIAARTDLTIIEKTSSASVRKNTQSRVNSVVIGKVPDRGGRPNEAQPPGPEMPQWQKRQAGSGGGQRQSGSQGWSKGGSQNQRDYGEGRGPRGGNQLPKVQSGWSSHGAQQGGNADQRRSSRDNSQNHGQNGSYSSGGNYRQHDDRNSGAYFDDNGGYGYADNNYHPQRQQNARGNYGRRDRGGSEYRGRGGGRHQY